MLSVVSARYARLLACHFHSEVTLLHVLEPPPYMLGPIEFGGIVESEVRKIREASAEKQIQELAAHEFGSMPVRTLVHAGDAARNIVELAHSEAVGLIVMPTRGYGPLRRSILGSVTAKVLHDAKCPVFTGVHLSDGAPAPVAAFRSVLCAVDLGPQSEEVLRWADQFASSFGIGLTVTHAMPQLAPLGGYANPEWKSRLEQQAGERLEALLKGTGRAAEILINDAGDPARAVCAAAERLESSLLVIGRGSAAGASGRLRSNAYVMIRQSPCPVVSV